MRAHYLQQVPFEGLGSIEPWLKSAGYQITRSGFFESTALPEVTEIDLLVVLGGPMSVNDEDQFPWLLAEKRFIREVIASRRPVLGICLGAQLIASALGARVYPNPLKEIGWFPVRAVAAEPEIFSFPEEVPAFHWHGETFDLPPGAVRLAASAGCKNQAFQLGANVIGLQFHLETTPASAQAMVTHCRDELVAGAWIQTEQQILSAPAERYATVNGLMSELLGYLLDQGSSGRSQRQPAYSLFETTLGLCAVVWKTCAGQDAILVSGFQLPEATPELAELRIRSRWPAQRALRVPPPIQNIIARVRLHFEGKVQDFSDIKLELDGVREFSKRVYAAARTIPAGRTMTYGQLAKAAGSASAARAVGSALSRNPIPLLIPCHRVLAAGNQPGGFSAHGGLRTKAQLLKIEGAPVPDFGQLDRES